MDIQKVINERQAWFAWRNIAPLREQIERLPSIEAVEVVLGDWVTLRAGEISKEQREIIEKAARAMKPWRKGPFDLFGIRIDSEWRSDKKYNLLRPYLDLEQKQVADVGCNNGYYMFRMLEMHPKLILGIDPSPLFRTQFDLINYYLQSDKLHYEMLGVEHMRGLPEMFDTVFCLGVLYHRTDPVATLKSLKHALKHGGELFLDTFVIDGDAPICLVPASRYAKIPNITFVPTIAALEHWFQRAGFERFNVLAIVKTDETEQRKTEWIDGESLEHFLDPNDPTKTVEGYPAPKRVYIKAYRK